MRPSPPRRTSSCSSPATRYSSPAPSAATPASARKAEAALRADLLAAGFIVADSSPIHITAGTAAGTAERKTYESVISTPVRRIETVVVIPQVYKVTIDIGGKTVWERSATFTPGSGLITLRGGESAQQAVDEQGRPSSAFFTNIRFPRHLIKPTDPPGYGSSSLTE